jgi:hypothetical protein
MNFLLAFAAAVLVATGALGALRAFDRRADRVEWQRLRALQPQKPDAFSRDMVAHLPEPARRYFGFAISEGAPILPVVEIDMGGLLSLGTKEAPNYRRMDAHQILAVPEGFVWSMRSRGGMPVALSDSGMWTRFWAMGLFPVARLGGDPDHARSAYGRYAAEAAIWAPAALLPGPGIAWSEVDGNTARVTVRHGALEQSVDVTVEADGRPTVVRFDRWSDANPDGIHRLQPFGGHLSDFREVDGYRLPFRVEAGNMFGTDDYFPFFLAEVTGIRFPKARK